MDEWFALALATALMWGVGGIFSKASTPRLGVARVAFLIATVEGALYFGAYLIWRQQHPFSAGDAVFAALSCLAGIAGYLCFFESIMEGQVAIAGTISAAFPALSVLGAIIFLSEELTAFQALGVSVVIIGVVGLSYERNPGAPHAMSRRSLMFSLLAFGFWGIWSFTSKAAINEVGAGNLFGFYAVCTLAAPLLYLWMKRLSSGSKGNGEHPSAKPWLLGTIGLGINVSGTYAFTFALDGGMASLVVPIASAYPIVTIVLAVGLLRERIDWPQVAALAAVVAGLVLIGITV
ncbi:MAG TPA: EamA family transporter [Thermoplasmata archaeon]